MEFGGGGVCSYPSRKPLPLKYPPLDSSVKAIQGPHSSSSTQNLLENSLREKHCEKVEPYNINHSDCRLQILILLLC